MGMERLFPGKGQYIVVGDCLKQRKSLMQTHGSRRRQGMLETRPGHGGRSGGCSRKSWGWFAANEVMGQVNKGEVSGAQRLTDVLWNV